MHDTKELKKTLSEWSSGHSGEKESEWRYCDERELNPGNHSSFLFLACLGHFQFVMSSIMLVRHFWDLGVSGFSVADFYFNIHCTNTQMHTRSFCPLSLFSSPTPISCSPSLPKLAMDPKMTLKSWCSWFHLLSVRITMCTTMPDFYFSFFKNMP